ncbi:hypothetical protein NNJEOMEG_02146 [Fundidesulfovibrio magnetotacticus]|uniref:Uncharacterized protein n=1 Tax=Fundidesulfovibrio magnetotacticus TaxID=2730080 RepID=A0A6V8LRF9_9BACT|nr:YhjD/YihY/BrkB family envelope integrity protein [Fundidesulfovibrio magnetotacticus]GFK94304.1 hypothetical protein NNJEOMEG_02146 [Fundidesulfovibrio magnetotacticus]
MFKTPLIIAWLRFVAASFLRNRGLLLAASLSYTTVLSLVPLLAVAFSVAKGFGIYEAPYLREALMRLTAEKGDVVDAVLGYIQNTNVKALGFIGVATLFVTSVGLISSMESAFNIIWHAPERKGLWGRFSNHVTVILVCPIFLLAAFSLSATLQNAAIVQWMREIELVNQALSLALTALPMAMVSVALFVVYTFLPNVRVRPLAALAGALAAGVAWQSCQALYIRYQIGVTGYNAIYGSFAQIPLLLVWLYVSWLIVLAGAEIANAAQNFVRVAGEDEARGWSVAERREQAVALALMLAARAEDRSGPLTAGEAARVLGVPVKFAEEELERLTRSGMALRAEAPGGDAGYALAGAPDRITVAEVAMAWAWAREDGEGPQGLPGPDRPSPETDERSLREALTASGAP